MPTKISVNLRGCLYKCRDGTKMHDKVIFLSVLYEDFSCRDEKARKDWVRKSR